MAIFCITSIPSSDYRKIRRVPSVLFITFEYMFNFKFQNNAMMQSSSLENRKRHKLQRDFHYVNNNPAIVIWMSSSITLWIFHRVEWQSTAKLSQLLTNPIPKLFSFMAVVSLWLSVLCHHQHIISYHTTKLFMFYVLQQTKKDPIHWKIQSN